MRRIFLLTLSMATMLFAPAARAQNGSAARGSPGIELRALDRATARVISVYGADAFVLDSRTTRVRRVLADADISLGTGFFVDRSGLLITAKHVVAGADVLAVIPAGSDAPHPAHVIYVDPRNDVAVLHVDLQPDALVAVPASARRLAVAEPLSGSGFPHDAEQRDPAAYVGVVGRENNDGSIHAYLPVNPGNSGGPVIDARGTLVGLVSRGSNVRGGSQGIAILEPVSVILPAIAAARADLATHPVSYTDGHRLAARLAADVAGTTAEVPLYERTSVELIEQATQGLPTLEDGMLLGLHAWNMHIALLENHEAAEIADLPEAPRAVATRLRSLATRILHQVFTQAPYLAVTYGAGLSILVQGDSSTVVRQAGGAR